MPPKVCGGGVLCYAVHHGKVYFLLGREAYVPGWRFGSSRWSDFAGGAHSGDEQLNSVDEEAGIEAATREFVEESMCAVPLTSVGDQTLPTCEDATWSYERAYALTRRLLSSGAYTAKLIERVRRGKSLHVTFLKRIEYIPDLPVRFARMRRQLVDLNERHLQIKSLDERVPLRHPFVRPGMRREDDGIFVTQVLTATYSARTGVLTIGVLARNDTKAAADADADSATAAPVRQSITIDVDADEDPRALQDYLHLIERRHYARIVYEGMAPSLKRHPALHISHYYSDQSTDTIAIENVVDIAVNTDYLEKDLLQYWPEQTLRNIVARQTDRVGNERFRLPFLRTIAVVLKHLHDSH
jgi:hypothetical protein